MKVLYEPHQSTFYFGPERDLRTYFNTRDTDLLSKYALHTYDYAHQRLLAKYEDCNAVFIKNMAYYIPKDRYSNYVEGDFSTFKHTFLIRNPHESILSRWKACKRSGFTFPGKVETDSYVMLCELFKFINKNAGRPVTVIDSADLLENPEYIMQQYCVKTGLPYDKKMLTWSPGTVEDWAEFNTKYYKDWHWNAMYSSGFNKDIRKENAEDSSVEVPPIVEEEIRKAMPFYEAMHEFHMTVR